MIVSYNGPRLTRQRFFHELINYLDQQGPVTLRQLKKDFPDQLKLDRSIEDYVQAAYIKRENRRYSNNFELLSASQLGQLTLDSPVFVETASPVFAQLQGLNFKQILTNETNSAQLIEQVNFTRDDLSLSSYFYKLKEQLPLSKEQEGLYAILGDVNPDYAMKYLTTFLLKFARKGLVMQKRPDIFVEALLQLGYIKKSTEAFKYELVMDFDQDQLCFSQPRQGQ